MAKRRRHKEVSKIKEKKETETAPVVKNIDSSSLINSKKIAYLLIIIGSLALVVSLYFAFITIRYVLKPPHPITRTTDVTLIQDWMSLPYIARTYRVPEKELLKGINYDSAAYKGENIKTLAKKTNNSSSEILSKIRQTVVEFQATHSPPPRRMEPKWTVF